MEWGRSYGDLLPIIRTEGAPICHTNNSKSLTFEAERMGLAGPNLFESEQKFSCEVKKGGHYCNSTTMLAQGAKFQWQDRGPRQQLKQPKHCSPQQS
jgi:hypothetical protein